MDTLTAAIAVFLFQAFLGVTFILIGGHGDSTPVFALGLGFGLSAFIGIAILCIISAIRGFRR